MPKRDIRVHLRHTGSPKLSFRATSWAREPRYYEGQADWGYNIEFGRWVLVFRDRKFDPPHYKPYRFFDLGMGRAMLKNRRLGESMTMEEHEAYETIRHQHPWQGIRLEVFLKKFRSGEITFNP